MKRWKLGLRVAAAILACTLLSGCGMLKTKDSEKDSEEEIVIRMPDIELPEIVPESEPEENTEEEERQKWEDHYTHYIQPGGFNNYSIDMWEKVSGMELNMRMKFSFEDNNYKSEIIMLDKKKQEKGSTILYYVDGMSYVETLIDGKRISLYRSDELDLEQNESVVMENSLGIDEEAAKDADYYGSEEIDGVIYDILHTKNLVTRASNANSYMDVYYYINRETQYLEKAVGKIVITVMEMEFTRNDNNEGVTAPKGGNSAKKLSEEDFNLAYGMSYLKTAFYSMGYDYRQLGLNY